MHTRLVRGPNNVLTLHRTIDIPDFPSLVDEIAEPRPDMNIKVTAFTVNEKSINITEPLRSLYCVFLQRRLWRDRAFSLSRLRLSCLCSRHAASHELTQLWLRHAISNNVAFWQRWAWTSLYSLLLSLDWIQSLNNLHQRVILYTCS